jgi:Transposase DDE domain
MGRFLSSSICSIGLGRSFQAVLASSFWLSLWLVPLAHGQLLVSLNSPGSVNSYNPTTGAVTQSPFAVVNSPAAVSSDGTDVYIASFGNGTIGKYSLTGAVVNASLVTGFSTPTSIAVTIVKRMRERFRLREITVVGDRGMVSQKTLAALEGSDPPVGYIIGVRMRRQKEVNLSVLRSRKQWLEIVPERSNAKDPAPLKIKEVWVENRRYVVCLNEEERRKDAHDREAIVAHLKEQLRQGDKSLVGNKGYRRYLKVQGDHHFTIDEKQIKNEVRYDGLWVLRTNTLYNAETVAHVYKALWTVEDIIRTTKSIMDTRPIYHRCNETIRGHVFCSFLALILKTELERRMKFADLKCEWAQVIRGLDALQQVEVTFQDKRFVLRSQLTGEASAALRATGVAAPPTLRELP